MIALPRGRRDNERGQALPLAAVGVFMVVLAVLATLNLGQAVHQKIKLQNTADAAAYTLAAMEARTFNYIAFLNRAQIAHYNTAMVIQSYMTYVGFHVSLIGTAADMAYALKGSVETGMKLPYPANLPYTAVYSLAVIMHQILNQLRNFAVQLYDVGHDIGHKIVEAMSIFNRATLWQSQLARAGLLNIHILTGMQGYIEKHDKEISFKNGKSVLLNLLVNMALNSIEYYMAFDNASGMNPFVYGLLADLPRVNPQGGDYTKHKDDKGKDAYRLMSELCQATRTPQFVSNRQGPAIGLYLGGTKMGQTKFTEKRDMQGAEIPPIGNEGNYPIGDTLSSDDFLQNGFGLISVGVSTAMYVSTSKKLGDAVTAYQNQGKHYKYEGNDTTGLPSPGREGLIVLGPPPVPPVPGETMETQSNKAKWPGFAPYFKFKANKDRTADFGQPSTWIFLNKHHKDFQTDGDSHKSEKAPWYANWSWKTAGGSGHWEEMKLDTTIGGKRNSFLFEGLTVISRGQAYYHRPKKAGDSGGKSNWYEQPNFFNPFWRARLAPVGQKLQNFWDRFVTSNITTKSDSAIIKGMVALLRNAQMDAITSVITSVITH